jgi:hypothetical protein
VGKVPFLLENKLIARCILMLPLLWAQVCGASLLCPPPEQPLLGQVLSQMNSARRGEDAVTCIRLIVSANELSELSDEVRYQLALQMSNAMDSLYEESRPLADDARDAANLWGEYLKNAGSPLDAKRLNFGVNKLIQVSRYLDFPQRLPVILEGVGKVGSLIEMRQSDFLFSTIKRCPNWSRVNVAIQCTLQCMEISDLVLTSLKSKFGELPWSGSSGISRLSLNASALNKEKLECAKNP